MGFFRVYLPLPQQCVPNPCSFWLLQQSQAEDILTHEIVKLDGFDWKWSFALAFKLVAEPLVAELSCKEAELQCICTLQIALEKSIGFKLKPDIAAEQVLLRVFGDQPVLLE